MLNEPLTEEEIIQKIGKYDNVGRCVSQAFAYVGNKCGYDVIDFREAKSRITFAKRCLEILICKGGRIKTNLYETESAMSLINDMKKGKEYCLCAGSHLAIVRITQDGKAEYLELQDKQGQNGWRGLDKFVLKKRFDAKYKYGASISIDIDLLKNDLGFRRLLGYINAKK